jgi:hypothetical protein
VREGLFDPTLKANPARQVTNGKVEKAKEKREATTRTSILSIWLMDAINLRIFAMVERLRFLLLFTNINFLC